MSDTITREVWSGIGGKAPIVSAGLAVLMLFVTGTPLTCGLSTFALVASATITLVLGILPQPLLELLASADVFIR